MFTEMLASGSGGNSEVKVLMTPYNQSYSIKIKNGMFYVSLNNGQTSGGYGIVRDGHIVTNSSYMDYVYNALSYDETTYTLSGKQTYNYGNNMKLVYVSDMAN